MQGCGRMGSNPTCLTAMVTLSTRLKGSSVTVSVYRHPGMEGDVHYQVGYRGDDWRRGGGVRLPASDFRLTPPSLPFRPPCPLLPLTCASLQRTPISVLSTPTCTTPGFSALAFEEIPTVSTRQSVSGRSPVDESQMNFLRGPTERERTERDEGRVWMGTGSLWRERCVGV